MKNKLLWMLFSLLGFASACSDDDEQEQNGNLCMYGCPSVTFSVKGTVTDEAGRPIPGIRVGIKNGYPTEYYRRQGGIRLYQIDALHHSGTRRPAIHRRGRSR